MTTKDLREAPIGELKMRCESARDRLIVLSKGPSVWDGKYRGYMLGCGISCHDVGKALGTMQDALGEWDRFLYDPEKRWGEDGINRPNWLWVVDYLGVAETLLDKYAPLEAIGKKEEQKT